MAAILTEDIPKWVHSERIINQFDNSYSWRYINNIDVTTTGHTPDWVKKVIEECKSMVYNVKKRKPEPVSRDESNYLFSGSYKMVFNIDGVAVAVELCEKDSLIRRKYVNEQLKKVDNCNIMVPTDFDSYMVDEDKGHHLMFSRMNYCVKGDLFSFVNENRNKPNGMQVQNPAEIKKYMIMLKDAGIALNELHKSGIYVLDIKPENTLVCTCPNTGKEVFAFTDLDDCVFKDEIGSRSYILTPGYSWHLMPGFEKIPPSSYDPVALEYTDWMAWSCTYLDLFIGAHSNGGFDPQLPFSQYVPYFDKWLNRLKQQTLKAKGLDLYEDAIAHFEFLKERKYYSFRDMDMSYPEDAEVTKRQVSIMEEIYSKRKDERKAKAKPQKVGSAWIPLTNTNLRSKKALKY